MPYVKVEVRDYVDPKMDAVVEVAPHIEVGVLNYLITKVVLAWLGKQPNYERINAAIGVLESAKQEFYRRIAIPYEDMKRDENGDVYV